MLKSTAAPLFNRKSFLTYFTPHSFTLLRFSIIFFIIFTYFAIVSAWPKYDIIHRIYNRYRIFINSLQHYKLITVRHYMRYTHISQNELHCLTF